MNPTSQTSSLKDFEIIEEIGKGAFGYVYKAKRVKDGEIYALKKVFMNKLKPKEKENSLNEIRILASITHNNVISYKEAFYDNASFSICIVMEFAENGDLERKISQNIKNKTFMSESDVVSFFVQIVLGLKALHDKKILHRDIKAANIFIFKNDVVKIGDLNVSKVNKNGLVHTQTGTPYYASPEVWNDKPYDSKSDIWSLGCLLYEMCCLKAPFRGTTMKGVYEKVMKGVYSPIPSFYSTALSNLISNMLSQKPISRPSCDQILAYIQDKMKNLKLTVNLSSGLGSISTASNTNLQNNQLNSINIQFDEIVTDSSNMNRSSTEKLLKTIKIPKKMIELNTMLPKSQYKKKRINSSFNSIQKNLDLNNLSSNNITQTKPDLNKTEIIGMSNKIDQDKSFNDISAYYRAQNKLIDDLLNEENDKPRILDKKIRDRSVNLKPISDKDLSGNGLGLIDNSCIDDPILKAINKPINLKKNFNINKVRNNLSANSGNIGNDGHSSLIITGNKNNSTIVTEPTNTTPTPIHKRILDLKREYVSNIVNITSPTNHVPKIIKEIPSLDDIKTGMVTEPVQNINNLEKYNNYHYSNKLVIVKPQELNSVNLNVVNVGMTPTINNNPSIANKTPLPSLNYKE
jgi:serine/threonine protein kinase